MAAGAAQERTSAVSGSVNDSSGASVPAATVQIVQIDTGSTRTVQSDVRGYYRAPSLEPGQYNVTAEKEGFRTSVRKGVLLAVDREAIVDHVLSIGERTESVVVAGEARLVEATPSTISSLVESKTIDELPLNGRDYIQLATLEAGAAVSRSRGRSVNTGYGIPISIAGSRPNQNSFLVDGVSVTSYTGSTPGSVNGVNLGVDAIREFSVQGSAYSAQYGRAGGGVVNAVTRSGGNEFHGSGYYFVRNDNFDARNFFDGPEVPEFRRQQYGASLGGPIVKNRAFFFANYEALRETRGNTTIDTTLSEDARNGNLAAGRVTVDPMSAKVAALYPKPNGQVFGDTGLFIFTNNEVGRQNFITGRVDDNLGSYDRLFFRYTMDDGSRQNQTDYALNSQANLTRPQSLVVEETHIFSAALLNTARFGFTREQSTRGLTRSLVPGTDNPELGFLSSSPVVGVILVPGLTDFPGGTGALDADINAFNSFQGFEDLSYLRGRHSIKVGGRVERTQFNTNSQNRVSGEFQFSNISNFLTNRPARFRALFPGSDTVRGYRQWIGAVYAEDTWKISRRLTVNLGLRYEWTTTPSEVNGKLANLVNLTDTQLRVGSLYIDPSKLNFAPRAGFAWDVLGNGATLVRGGYGVYPDLILSQYLLLAGIRNPPFFLRGETRVLRQGDFPKGGEAALVNNPTPELRVERLDPNPSQPYVQHWNFTVEQKAGKESTVRLSYVGSRGLHLSSVVEDADLVTPIVQPDGRMYFPPSAPRINPVWAQIRNRIFDASSSYHGLNAQYRWRFQKGVQVLASYVYSKSIDDSSNFFAKSEGDNYIGLPYNGSSRFNRGLSANDVRHSLVGSGTWEVPSPQGRALRAVLGGWQLGLIASYASGMPLTARLSYDAAGTKTSRPDNQSGQRPDLAPGASNNPVTGDPLRWIDPSAFLRPQPGYLGNVGRNTIIGPDMATFDFALVKRMIIPKWGERTMLDFRCEFFNAFNRTNFDMPTQDRMEIFGPTSTREDVGRITSAESSREIQFGLKLRF
jgi:hypothetical protein